MREKLTFYRPVDLASDRLQHAKLKNALCYWEGGVSHLQCRTRDMARALRLRAPAAAGLLDELSRYFRDLEKLLRETCPEAPRDR